MNILWLTPGFAADEQDDTCIPPLQLLARALRDQGVAPTILPLEYPFRADPYQWHRLPVFPCNGQNRRWHKPFTFWKALEIGQQQLEQKRFAAIHSFWLGWGSSIGEWLSKRNGIPHFTTLAGQDVLSSNWAHLKRLRPGREKRLVALSNFQQQVFRQTTGLEAGHLIPWGVEEALTPTALVWQARPIEVLGVGSLVPVKNWEKWLRVLARAALDRPQIQAVLIGDGPQRQYLQQLAEQLGLGQRVHFAGALTRQTVLSAMSRSKILLHTATFESFGFVYPEAAAQGCALVSTPVGIAPEMGADCAEADEALAQLLQQRLAATALSPLKPLLTMQDTAARYKTLWSGYS